MMITWEVWTDASSSSPEQGAALDARRRCSSPPKAPKSSSTTPASPSTARAATPAWPRRSSRTSLPAAAGRCQHRQRCRLGRRPPHGGDGPTVLRRPARRGQQRDHRTVQAGVHADRAVVNTSSGSGLLNPLPAQVSYAAGNAGVAALTIVSALELGRYGVRVNCISPSTAYLAGAACPLTGQILSVRGGTVAVNHGWSLGDHIHRRTRHRRTHPASGDDQRPAGPNLRRQFNAVMWRFRTGSPYRP
jgi:NAD(P)-dependent dehydrogenase (short-subunit alcohol dehydrogenase family)